MKDVLPHLFLNINGDLTTTVEVMAWLINYMPMFYINMTTCLCPDLYAGWADRC